MRANRSRQIHQGVELLHLARARHREEPGDGEFTVRAPIAEHDLAPLHGRPERAFGAGMPRAGLCRVVEFAPTDFEFHLGLTRHKTYGLSRLANRPTKEGHREHHHT